MYLNVGQDNISFIVILSRENSSNVTKLCIARWLDIKVDLQNDEKNREISTPSILGQNKKKRKMTMYISLMTVVRKYADILLFRERAPRLSVI